MPLGHYLVLSGLLFAIGAGGVFLRRNLITLLLSVEIMLNSVNVSLAAFSQHLSEARGQVLALFVIAVAAGEAAIGLGLVLALSRNRQGVYVEDVTDLRW